MFRSMKEKKKYGNTRQSNVLVIKTSALIQQVETTLSTDALFCTTQCMDTSFGNGLKTTLIIATHTHTHTHIHHTVLMPGAPAMLAQMLSTFTHAHQYE